LLPPAGVGILGIDLATRRRNRANGRVVRGDREGLDVVVEQSFGNCAKYIQRREIMPDGLPVAVAAAPKELAAVDAEARRLIAGSDTFFVASSAEGAVDVSHRGGRPGFVHVDGEVLTIPDFSGNRYFNTFGNFLISPRAGLLFIDFTTGDLLHLSGKVEIVWESDEVRQFTGAERLWHVRVSHGWRRRGALGLRWALRGYAPTTERTGMWDFAASEVASI
jgi:predicted pyridoxine 5'-phosphate oxidase superfamily flavin-nucleotide-binding protein